jgi:hypothetical protein
MKVLTFCITLLSLLCFASSSLAYEVKFNTNTYKYHNLKCEYAIKCTRNCIKIDHKEAQRRGGVPCKICDGTDSQKNVVIR